MADFIPDNQFVPDEQADNTDREPAVVAAPKPPAAASSSSGFIPDNQFESDEDKYGSLGQQGIAALEGAAKGVAGPLATAFETNALGVKPEDIRGREAANPVTHYGSEIAGLVGGALLAPEASLGGALEGIGTATKAASEAAGLGKIGSSVIASAAGNAAYQLGDEASKMLLHDPGQSADTVAVDMGLATLIGGGFGAISPLWHLASGKKLGGVLGAVVDKAGGIEGIPSGASEEALARSGLDIAPELRGMVSNNPAVQEMARTLNQSDTSSAGRSFQQAYKDMTNQAGDKIIETLGSNPEAIKGLPELSDAAAGKRIGATLAAEYSENLSPLSKGFDEIKEKMHGLELPETTAEAAGSIDSLKERLAELAIKEGWATSPSSEGAKVVNSVIKELPLQKNLKDLSQFISQVGSKIQSDPLNGELRRATGAIVSVLRDEEGEVMATHIGSEEGPNAVEHFRELQNAYRVESAKKDFIQSRLATKGSTGGYANSILEAVRDYPEGVLRKLDGTGDAEWLDFIQKHYPKTAQSIKDYHLNNLFEKAASKAKEGATIDNTTLLNKVKNMPQELRDFVVSKDAQEQLVAIGTALDAFKNPNHNFSNTARVSTSLLKDVGAGAAGMLMYATGHGFAASALAGILSKTIGKEAPDALRLMMLKFLGSNKQISPGAFKTSFDYIKHTIDGETALSKATKSLFKSSSQVIPASLMPTEKDRAKLNKVVMAMQQDPQDMLSVTGSLGHYMPEHATALAQTAANAVNYIHSKKPITDPVNPLDSKREMNVVEKSKYDRVLNIAQQPLMPLKYIADGTLTLDDVHAQQALYPALYQRTLQKLTDQVAQAKADGTVIPYKTKMALSLYMGQPMDSTLTPGAIQAAQPMQPQAQPQTAMQPASNPKRSTNALNKLPAMYKTQSQAAAADRSNRA